MRFIFYSLGWEVSGRLGKAHMRKRLGLYCPFGYIKWRNLEDIDAGDISDMG